MARRRQRQAKALADKSKDEKKIEPLKEAPKGEAPQESKRGINRSRKS